MGFPFDIFLNHFLKTNTMVESSYCEKNGFVQFDN